MMPNKENNREGYCTNPMISPRHYTEMTSSETIDCFKLANSLISINIQRNVDHWTWDNVESGKDSEFSQGLRKKGNEMYGKRICDKEYEEIHEYYSRSIALAPVDSDDLALAYGNRSALLHRIHKYRESILDIDRALDINKSNIAVVGKLLCRKVECLAALGSPESQQVYRKVEYLLPEILERNQNEKSFLDNKRKAEVALENMTQLPKVTIADSVPDHSLTLKKKQLQNPFDSVTGQYNKQFGKHLVATRDFQPGEIIFVENSDIGCINTNKAHLYCGHCFAKTWASIPCDYCSWCMFCSEKCKESAWMDYHHTECSVISYLIHTNHTVDYHCQLSLRSLIMGVQESGSITNFIIDTKSMYNWIDNVSSKGSIINNGFKTIYSLRNKFSGIILRKYADEATLILGILCKYTQFFGQSMTFTNLSELQTNQDVVFVGSALLLLCSATRASLNTVHDQNSKCKLSSGSSNCNIANCSVGACIPPLNFFINHSCNPNVGKLVTEDHKVIVYSLVPIDKNTRLLRAYDTPFYIDNKFTREGRLILNTGGRCYCDACKFSWPSIEELWKMPIDNPKLYIKNYNKTESDLHDLYDKLVRPIIVRCQKVQYNQATLNSIANAIEHVTLCLEQPSVVLCELIISLELTFKNLYFLKSS